MRSFSDENQACFDSLDCSKVAFFGDKGNPVCSRDVKAFCFLCWTTTVMLIWRSNTESDGEGKHLKSCSGHAGERRYHLAYRCTLPFFLLATCAASAERRELNHFSLCIKRRSRKLRQVSQTRVMRSPVKWCDPDCVARLRCSSLMSPVQQRHAGLLFIDGSQTILKSAYLPPTVSDSVDAVLTLTETVWLHMVGSTCRMLSYRQLLTSLSNSCCIFIKLIYIMRP